MNRSSVKLEIFYILEKLTCHPEGNISIAEEILSKIEELGMSPPEVSEPCQTIVIDSRTGQQLQVENSTVFVRKWEEE